MFPNLSINLGNLSIKNPVMNASGTFEFFKDNFKLFDYHKLGALVTKTITLKPCVGNLPPRIIETPAGVINSIGLQNPGFDYFVKYKLPELKKIKTKIIVSIAGETVKEYFQLASLFKHIEGVDGLEINISCPNLKNKMPFSHSTKMTYEILNKIKENTFLPLIAKISPVGNNIKKIVLAAEKAGVSALAFANTFPAMAIDIYTKKSKLGNFTGGLSGPAIKPIVLKMVYEITQVTNIPVIGLGGIFTACDALEFIIAGATAVGIGTANFIEPKTMVKIIEGIKTYLIKNQIDDINKLRGTIKCSV